MGVVCVQVMWHACVCKSFTFPVLIATLIN